MTKEYEDRKLKLHFIILGFIIISACCLSIGYASLESITLDIKGEITALPQTEIFITDVQYNTNVGANVANSNIEQYYQTLMQSTVNLGKDGNSSITYNITMYNSGNQPYTFKEVEYTDEFYDNPNITFDLDGLKRWDVVQPKQYITFSITFHYLNNSVVDNNILNSYLNFRFMKGTVDDTNVRSNIQSVKIYNANTDKVKIDLTNDNDFAVEVNLTLDNNVIGTMALEPTETKSIEHDVKNNLATIESNKEFTVKIEQTAPYIVSKDTSVKVTVIPTVTNYDLGLKSAGTQQNPYIIYKIEDLVRLAKNVNSGDAISSKNIKQINTLNFQTQTDYYDYQDTSFGDLNEDNTDGNQVLTEMTTGTGFSVIGEGATTPFKGIFDGGNNRLENLYIKRTNITEDIKTALFGYIEGATIRDLSIAGTIELSKDGASLVGGLSGNNTITNCHNFASVTGVQIESSIGGLIGVTMKDSVTTLTKCSNNGDVTNITSASGVVGFVIISTLNMNDCYNTGTITSTDSTPATEAHVEGKSFTAGLVSKDSSTGGTINIRRCYNKGAINGNFNVGGLVSRCSGKLEIESSYNIGKITGTSRMGGILGSNNKLWYGTAGNANIQNTYNAGEISGTSNVGGIIGYQNEGTSNITKAYYLTQTNLKDIGDLAGTNGAKEDEYMKSSEFVTLLGNEFTSDISNTNGGYPVLK